MARAQRHAQGSNSRPEFSVNLQSERAAGQRLLYSSAPSSRMRVTLAGQADVAVLLETLDSAVSQTLQARPPATLRFEHARSRCVAQMHAADGLSAEDAEALRVPLAAMAVRACSGSAAGWRQRAQRPTQAARRRASRRSSCTA